MLKRLLNTLFGSSSETTKSQGIEPIAHEGFLIYPEPQREGGNIGSRGASAKTSTAN